MAEQIEFNQQKELITNENMDSLTPSTSNPSDNPVKRSPSKKKTVNIYLFLGQKYLIQNLCPSYQNKI